MTRLEAILPALVFSACATARMPSSPPAADGPVAACAAPADRTQPAAAFSAAPVKIDGETAKHLVAQGARLVDVRAAGFYGREHIAGAINVPVAAVAARASEIGPPETPIILYCRTGSGSARAAQTLAGLGYTHVYDLGSYLNWGEGAPAPTPLPPAQ